VELLAGPYPGELPGVEVGLLCLPLQAMNPPCTQESRPELRTVRGCEPDHLAVESEGIVEPVLDDG
jgi:hypothetical protein